MRLNFFRTCLLLLAILALSACLRLVLLGQSPPGFNQDEAGNAWNTFCLLKTGCDETGQKWPIFYSSGFGGNRSTLFYYILLPFQAIGGMSIYTTRLPAALSGVATVWLLYYVVSRLFSVPAGLLAAALLAVNPWNIQLSRWGHEASLSPILTLLPFALLIGSGLITTGGDKKRPKPILAALAGLTAAIACYGYHSIRIFIPIFLAALAIATLQVWRDHLKTKAGKIAILSFIIAFSAAFGPLAWKHLTDPQIGANGKRTLIWNVQPGPPGIIAEKILNRYLRHFGPEFLFTKGDQCLAQKLPDSGELQWYLLPLIIAGAIVVLRKLKISAAAKILLTWVLVYPVGDSLAVHPTMHALRSSPGLCALIALAAVGGAAMAKWLLNRQRRIAISLILCFVAIAASLDISYLRRFFVQYNRTPEIYYNYHTDLVEACKWLKPRFERADAVFCTTWSLNQPYITTLVGLNYQPKQWFADKKIFSLSPDGWELCDRYGKMFFMYDASWFEEIKRLRDNNRKDSVIIISRPNELKMNNPAYEIKSPSGEPALWLFEDYL